MKTSIRAYDVASLLEQVPSEVTTLSLDCFDTLLWRDVQAPRDVFARIDLEGGAVEPRMWAERAARQAAKLHRKTVEVTLPEIYTRLMPAADEDAIAAAVAHECALEARHCFAFAPTVELIRRAHARGMRVIIVSDIYFSHAELVALLKAVAGEEVVAMIDRVFVSSEYGIGKGDGLFKTVMAELGAAPETILHVGDNKVADVIAPQAVGIHAAHLVQFDEESVTRLRLESAAATLIDPEARVAVPVSQNHRAAVALRREDSDVARLGHDVLGPLFHGFALWVRDEVAALTAQHGRQVKPLFLMRDGFLPLEVFRTVFSDAGDAAPIEISRYVAACASLTDAERLKDFVTEAVHRAPLSVVARQLLLFGHEGAKLAKMKPAQFCKAVLEPKMAKRILARSAKFTDRVLAHLRQAGVNDGDTVMFVDLGYNGSVQNQIAPVLAEKMGLHVVGRYLLLREEVRSGLDKKGFFDVRHYETRMLHALCTQVAVIEQLATVAQGSTVDYEEDGAPIRKEADIKGGQSAIRDKVQAACIAYARDAETGVMRVTQVEDADDRRRSAAAALARLMFFPSAEEVTLLEAFDHDVNLGTTEVVRLLDRDNSAEGLKRRGLSYINETDRMFVPGELRGHGLPLNLSLLASTRFALDIRNADFQSGGIELPVILMSAQGQGVHNFDAYPTAQGFYRINIPMGQERWTPAIQFGVPFGWVQVESAMWHRLADFDASAPVCGANAVTVTDGMTDHGDALYQCSPSGFVMAPPPKGDEPMVLSVVFRPVVWRKEAGSRKQVA
ncbi:hypothetical protein GCM10023219_14600 [Stakelama sediminis]|uniref:FMN phosphatase YigB (HAD superfamily) n=1 Tax=Stakelama sediminis TaxID=463200 RepID=A0A840YX94_9SPHN|nr:HAD family hydrolase [Stakelama sediminis]MBB5718185.1 FMN phosphatase YigB (HAD superfamily) [Stakelama sediminis]